MRERSREPGRRETGPYLRDQSPGGSRKLIDVLSAAGLRTGEALSRAEVHHLGKRHRAIHLYLFNSRDELLVQRRSLTVDNFPGTLSVSVTGHVDAGEYSATTVRREVEEELGLDASAMRFDFVFSHYREAVLGKDYTDRHFTDVYVSWVDIDPTLLQLDPSEVVEATFVPWGRFVVMASNDASEVAPVYAEECRELRSFLGGR